MPACVSKLWEPDASEAVVGCTGTSTPQAADMLHLKSTWPNPAPTKLPHQADIGQWLLVNSVMLAVLL